MESDVTGVVLDLPLPDIHVSWASHHIWRSGQALYGNAPGTPALWLMRSGTVDVTIAERRWRVVPPLAFLSPQHVPRDILVPSGAEWLSAGIRARLLGRLDLFAGLDQALLWEPVPADRQRLELSMAQLIEESARHDVASGIVREGLARVIVGLCLRSLSDAGLLEATHWNVPSWLAVALRQMRRQPQVGVQQLADTTGFSPAQFRRRFHECVGVSPRTYLQAERLTTARRLLETDSSIGDVARAAGFRSHAYFSRCFTQALGVTPTGYRKATKAAKV